MQRTTAHKKRPGDAWQTSLDALNSTTFYLLARTGPTVFSIKDDTEKVYKISVGNPHGCSCGLHSSENLCIHMMYVLLKVLKVPATHELSYQTSLTDAEITQVLSGSCSTSSSRVVQARLSVAAIRQQREASRRRGSGASSSGGGGSAGAGDDGKEDNGFVPRQVLDEDEPLQCPICQDDMTKEQALTWCRKGCGNNMHAKCMQTYAQYKIGNREAVGCPLCREDWALDLLKDDCRGRASLKNSCAPVYCATCTFPLRGDFHRCIECSQAALTTFGKKPVDFCMRCFPGIGREHATHHFVVSDAGVVDVRDVAWRPVANPRAPPRLLEPDVLATLQQRELGTEDYDLLLALDKQGPPDLPTQLLLALPEEKSIAAAAAAGDMAAMLAAQPTILKCWCRRPRPDDVVRVLPCQHTCHESCLKAKLLEVLTDSAGADANANAGLLAVLCQHHNCKARAFPGLNRRRKKKRTAAAAAADGSGSERSQSPAPTSSSSSSSSLAAAAAANRPGAAVGVAGMGITGVGGIAATGVRGALRLGPAFGSAGGSRGGTGSGLDGGTSSSGRQPHNGIPLAAAAAGSLTLSATSLAPGADTSHVAAPVPRPSDGLVGFGSRVARASSARRAPSVERDVGTLNLSVGAVGGGGGGGGGDAAPQPHMYGPPQRGTGRLQRPPRPRRLLMGTPDDTLAAGGLGGDASLQVAGSAGVTALGGGLGSLGGVSVASLAAGGGGGGGVGAGMPVGPAAAVAAGPGPGAGHRHRRLEQSRSAGSVVAAGAAAAAATGGGGSSPSPLLGMGMGFDVNGRRLGSVGGAADGGASDAVGIAARGGGGAPVGRGRRRIVGVGHGLVGLGSGAQSAVGLMLRDAVIEDSARALAPASASAAEATSNSSSMALVVRAPQTEPAVAAAVAAGAPRSPIRARVPRVVPGDVGGGGSVASIVLSPPRASSVAAGNVDLCLNVTAY